MDQEKFPVVEIIYSEKSSDYERVLDNLLKAFEKLRVDGEWFNRDLDYDKCPEHVRKYLPVTILIGGKPIVETEMTEDGRLKPVYGKSGVPSVKLIYNKLVEAGWKRTYWDVIVIHNNPDSESKNEIIYTFQGEETAREYARRRTRDSLEELRSEKTSPEELKKLWLIYGESCSVLEASYKASDEIEYFILHPATVKERDWQSIKEPEKIFHDIKEIPDIYLGQYVIDAWEDTPLGKDVFGELILAKSGLSIQFLGDEGFYNLSAHGDEVSFSICQDEEILKIFLGEFPSWGETAILDISILSEDLIKVHESRADAIMWFVTFTMKKQ